MQAVHTLIDYVRAQLSKIEIPEWVISTLPRKIASSIVAFFVGLTLLVTSFIWLPLVLLVTVPVLFVWAVIFLVKEYVRAQIKVAKYSVHASYSSFNMLNDVLTLVYPKSFPTIDTVGYADNSQSGIYQVDFQYHHEVFQMQLYNFVTLMMPGTPTLDGKSIIELGCRKGGGLHYLNTVANPARVIGVDADERNVQFCKINYKTHKNVHYLQAEAKDLKSALSEYGNHPADVVLSIESSHEF